MSDQNIISNAPTEPVEVIDTDGYSLFVTHFSQSLNAYMVRDDESGQWFSYDEELGYLCDELAQGDMRLLSDIEKLNKSSWRDLVIGEEIKVGDRFYNPVVSKWVETEKDDAPFGAFKTTSHPFQRLVTND